MRCVTVQSKGNDELCSALLMVTMCHCCYDDYLVLEDPNFISLSLQQHFSLILETREPQATRPIGYARLQHQPPLEVW